MFCTSSHLSRISLVLDKSVTHFWIWFRNGALYLPPTIQLTKQLSAQKCVELFKMIMMMISTMMNMKQTCLKAESQVPSGCPQLGRPRYQIMTTIMNYDENGVDGYDTKPRVTMTIIDGVRCGSNTSNHSKKPLEDEYSF